MRIGVDACCWSNRRGFGRFTREILTALLAMDEKNEYSFFVDRQTASEYNFPERARLVVIDTRLSPTRAASAAGRRSFGDLWAMTQAVWRHRLDLFFFPTTYSYFPILNRTKIISGIHDMTSQRCPMEIFPDRKLRFFWNLKERLAVWQSNMILTVSQFSKQEIMQFYKVPESRMAIVTEGPNGVFKVVPRDRRFTETLGRHKLDSSERYLLYVGGISPHKNLQSLIRAYRHIAMKPGFSDLKLVLVGDYQGDPFHSDYPALSRLVGDFHMENKVLFAGYVRDEDLVFLYNGASLLVFPSLGEGFGLPAVESMVCGTPVAASRAGSLPEILGDAGLFFDPRNTNDMQEIIERVLGDDCLREQMRGKGLERARRYTWKKAAEDLIGVFEKLVKEPSCHGQKI